MRANETPAVCHKWTYGVSAKRRSWEEKGMAPHPQQRETLRGLWGVHTLVCQPRTRGLRSIRNGYFLRRGLSSPMREVAGGIVLLMDNPAGYGRYAGGQTLSLIHI